MTGLVTFSALGEEIFSNVLDSFRDGADLGEERGDTELGQSKNCE